MYLWQEDYDRARHYCSTALHAFLQVSSYIDLLMVVVHIIDYSKNFTKRPLQAIEHMAMFVVKSIHIQNGQVMDL